MKLIIDIPEEVYNYIMRLEMRNMGEEYIKNGIPLDKIRAEIESYKKHPLITKEETYCLNWVVNMLDGSVTEIKG